MKGLLLILPLSMAFLTSCDMERKINAATSDINRNTAAIERSTDAIEKNLVELEKVRKSR